MGAQGQMTGKLSHHLLHNGHGDTVEAWLVWRRSFTSSFADDCETDTKVVCPAGTCPDDMGDATCDSAATPSVCKCAPGKCFVSGRCVSKQFKDEAKPILDQVQALKDN